MVGVVGMVEMGVVEVAGLHGRVAGKMVLMDAMEGFVGRGIVGRRVVGGG